MRKNTASRRITLQKTAKKHSVILLLLLIFLIAMMARVIYLSDMGRSVDEEEGAIEGYKLTELARVGDFSNDYWWRHSPDHPPLTKYIRGLVSRADIIGYEENGTPLYAYDFRYTRLFSAILTSLTAVMVAFIGIRYISKFVGVTAGILFSLLPPLLGHSTSIMWEPYIIFFFTACEVNYLLFLENPKKRYILLTGALLGCSVLVKESNMLLPPLLILQYFVWKIYSGKRDTKQRLLKIFLIYFLGLLVFVLLWPMPFFHLDYIIPFTQKMRFSSPYSVPEIFFGRLLLVPKTYYLVYLFITTPILILAALFIGIYDTVTKRSWILLAILVWFCFPFLQSLYPMRQQGLRYIIEIYAPLSIIAAIGFDKFITQFTKNLVHKILLLIAFSLTIIIPLYKIAPYYYDYFNVLVGGSGNVYRTKSFQQGWWGNGAKEAGEYLRQNAHDDAKVGIAISPNNKLMPHIGNMQMSAYTNDRSYDYVVLNHYNLIREGFDDSNIKKKYNLVYQVDADGAKLVYVYKRK